MLDRCGKMGMSDGALMLVGLGSLKGGEHPGRGAGPFSHSAIVLPI